MYSYSLRRHHHLFLLFGRMPASFRPPSAPRRRQSEKGGRESRRKGRRGMCIVVVTCVLPPHLRAPSLAGCCATGPGCFLSSMGHAMSPMDFWGLSTGEGRGQAFFPVPPLPALRLP